MTKLLAWDTSSKVGSIVALEWDAGSKAGWSGVRLVSEWTLNVDSTHSEGLLWGIHQVLEVARWKPADLDVFAVGVGPGSFTGLRIGVTTARTLAHTLGKPLLGISSLATLARPAALHLNGLDHPTVLAACTDACKGELFALSGAPKAIADCVSMADGDYPGLWKRGAEERVIRPPDLVKLLIKKLGKSPRGRWVVVGEGRQRYAETWAELPAAKELKIPLVFPDHVQGRYLGLLAWEAMQAGLAREGLMVHPRYLRASDAELKLKAGLLKPAPL